MKRNTLFPLLAITTLVALSCSSEVDETEGEPSPEDTRSSQLPARNRFCELGRTDTLKRYAEKCDAAMGGVTVPEFYCDCGTPIPRQGFRYGGENDEIRCDAPNVLTGECDPGSRFQVLHRDEGGDGIYIVAHCRKHNGVFLVTQDNETCSTTSNPGTYADIAVIQYNSKTGATCFYQALDTQESLLPSRMKPPSQGTVADGGSPWFTPKATADIKCVECHDNGPFVRSPYLAQLSGIWPHDTPNPPPVDPNYLPGTHPTNGEALFWNDAKMPYSFVGADFQSWEAYRIVPDLSQSTPENPITNCNNCHRMGAARVSGNGSAEDGSSIDMGLRATNPMDAFPHQLSKNPHSTASPIWMTLSSVTEEPPNMTGAQMAADCAESFASGEVLRPGCHAELVARGDTCGPPNEGIINGKTNSASVGFDYQSEIELGCKDGRECPLGFYYWTSIHGPFFQNSQPSVDIDSEYFRGSFLRITDKNGKWVVQSRMNAADLQEFGQPSPGAPGGTYSWITFPNIASIPDPDLCTSDGEVMLEDSIDAGTILSSLLYRDADAGLGILTGFIGNVARTSSDKLRLLKNLNKTLTLTAIHYPSTTKNPWFRAEGRGPSCNGWSTKSVFAVRDKFTDTDVQLVPSSKADSVRCYITGITGDWSAPRLVNGNQTQAFAEIYLGPNKEWRLRVASDRYVFAQGSTLGAIGAYASCIYID